MSFISVTRLRLRSVVFVPFFAVYTGRALRQVRRAPGFLRGKLLPDRDWTFWTLTLWTDRESMRDYITTGAHKAAMPRLMRWCDEASVVHFKADDDSAPSWEEVDARMRKHGRASKVHHPSSNHADLTYRPPRTSRSATI